MPGPRSRGRNLGGSRRRRLNDQSEVSLFGESICDCLWTDLKAQMACDQGCVVAYFPNRETSVVGGIRDGSRPVANAL